MVAAGVTGAGIAMPLFGAVGAQAAEVQTWDRVAECESGGMWSANEGNGFYGGLQITLDMWKKYGGQRYAPRPDLASRSQQIAVAQAILADRGPDAWPSCALSAGLADLGDALGGTPDAGRTPESKETTGPGEADAPTTGESSDSSGRSDKTGTSDSSGESDTSDKAGESDSAAPGGEADGESDSPSGGTSGGASDGTSGDSSAGSGGASHQAPSPDRDAPGAGEDSTSAPTGRHRGAPDAREGRSGDAADQARPSGRHASRDDADRAKTPLQPLGRADYTVRTGDNLSGIADEQKVDGGWPELYEANDSVIGTDPDLIHPGQRLDLSVR
ncbi:transglycosylase family protein [Streptomyces sparsogenes]|uniref:transglycosylase family protein n=1 Tax=Streptomyces sparsogenes TaxID=67365 RepID=UPI00333354D4